MTLRKLSLAFCFTAAVALPLSAQISAISRSNPTAVQDNLPIYTEAESTVIATRLYRALLNREPDPGGLAGTISEIRAGGLRSRVTVMVASPEFASTTLSQQPETIVVQFFRGLLGRSVDAASSGHLPAVQERRYVDEVISIIKSEEFRTQLAAAAGTVSTSAGATVSSAFDCQESVVEAVRNDLTGFVYIQFDNAAINGSVVSGAATDVSDGGRRMTYRCDGNTSYSYDDGRRARSAPGAGEFASDIVRSCQGEIRTKVQRTGAADVEFESAGLMPGGDVQAVRGLGFRKSRTGANGANFHYSCDMRGTQILVSSFRGR